MYATSFYPTSFYPGSFYPPSAAARAILDTGIALGDTDGYSLGDFTPACALLDVGPELGIVLAGGCDLADATPMCSLLALTPPGVAPDETPGHDLRDVTPRRDLLGASPLLELAPLGGYGIEHITAARTLRKSG